MLYELPAAVKCRSCWTLLLLLGSSWGTQTAQWRRTLAQVLSLFADVANLTISTNHCDANTHACCLQALQLLHDCVGNGAPSSNWGDGFASQPAVLALFPTCDISDPGPVFFEPLLTRAYLSQVTAPSSPCSSGFALLCINFEPILNLHVASAAAHLSCFTHCLAIKKYQIANYETKCQTA